MDKINIAGPVPERIFSKRYRLGILGGGQLGKMLIQAASAWNIDCRVLDPDDSCPASEIANVFTKGDFRNYNDVIKFGQTVDLLTIEIENVNTEALVELGKAGKIIYPPPHVIDIVKDKAKQKEFYVMNGIPTAPFRIFQEKKEVINAIDAGEISFPFVQKKCTEGYDGRGVSVVSGDNQLSGLFDGRILVEPKIDVEMELSVLVCRNSSGEINVFPPVEMEFSEKANLVELLLSPARISPGLSDQAVELARKVSASFEMTGIMAVEMFLSKGGDLMINEVAPRPHNSGHHTIEANSSSQYGQHLRAILGLPLGHLKTLRNAAMINLLGTPGKQGPVVYRNLEAVLEIPESYLHIYGKKETKPYRKMGHITICGSDISEILSDAKELKKSVVVDTA